MPFQRTLIALRDGPGFVGEAIICRCVNTLCAHVSVCVHVHSCARRCTCLHSSRVCRCSSSRVVDRSFVRPVSVAQLVTYRYAIKHCCRMPRYVRPKPNVSKMYQRTVSISHPTVIANARHEKQTWISVVHGQTLASMSLVFERPVSVAPSTVSSSVGTASAGCKCNGEEPLRFRNVLSHGSAVV